MVFERYIAISACCRIFAGDSLLSGNKAIPILGIMPIIPAAQIMWDVRSQGPIEMVRNGVYKLTGFDPKGEGKFKQEYALATLGLVVAGIIGHKVANRTGINRHIKKLTMGFVQL